MIALRRSEERGHFDHGWLDARHSFSFAAYQDARHMGFRHLRVINEDRVKPGKGFGMHSHQDMEIVTWILSGALEHKDNLGNGSVIRHGDIQRMSAGTGVTHSEFNPSASEPVHLLQIWILPRARGMRPSWEQKSVPEEEMRGTLRLVGSPEGGESAVTIHQDVALYVSSLKKGQSVSHDLAPGRHSWVQVASGSVTLNGTAMQAGDGAAISDERRLLVAGREPAEFLLFDLA